MKNKNRSKRVVIISIFILATSLILVALDGYHQLMDGGHIQQSDLLVKPLDPQIDTRVIEEVEKRRGYQISEIDALINERQVVSTGSSETLPVSKQ